MGLRRSLAVVASVVVVVAIVSGCEDENSTATDDQRPGEAETPTSEPTRTPSSEAPTGDRPSGDPTGRPTTPDPDDDPKPRRPPGDDDRARPGSGFRPEFGAVYHGMWDMTWSDRAELLDKLVATGATWVRIGVQWSALQTSRPTAGDPGWSMGWGVPKADRVINQAVRRGLKVSVTFLRTPDWANGGLGPERLPSDPESYARAIQWLAHRYRDRVASWEIFNEPNNPNHLQASVADYVELLCAAYPAVHRGDPTARVVFGGTSGVDYEYIDAAYDAGAASCFDVLAVHPYNGPYSPIPEARSDHRWWWRNIELVRRVMLRHGDRATPVWFTEYGWSTHANRPGTSASERGVTPEQQARYAVQLLRITRREYPYVRRAAWYAARDESTSTLENNNFGLFTLDLRPKPIVGHLREFLAH